MQEIGADVAPVKELVGDISAGVSWREALARISRSAVPNATLDFVAHTLSTVEANHTAAPHVVAANFLLGREDPIPGTCWLVTRW